MDDFTRRDAIRVGVIGSGALLIPGISAADVPGLFQTPCSCPRIEGPMQVGDYHLSSQHESPFVQFNRAVNVIEVAVRRLEGNGIGQIYIPANGQEPEVMGRLRAQFDYIDDALQRAAENSGPNYDARGEYSGSLAAITSSFERVLPNQPVVRDNNGFIRGLACTCQA